MPETLTIDLPAIGRFLIEPDGFITTTAAGDTQENPVQVIRNWPVILAD